MSENNKRVVQRAFRQVWNEGNLALVDKLFAQDWVGHAPSREFGGPAELREFIAAQRRAFPELRFAVENQIAEGDTVATRWTAQGTHPDRGPNAPAAEWRTRATGISIARLADGKIVESWTEGQLPVAL